VRTRGRGKGEVSRGVHEQADGHLTRSAYQQLAGLEKLSPEEKASREIPWRTLCVTCPLCVTCHVLVSEGELLQPRLFLLLVRSSRKLFYTPYRAHYLFNTQEAICRMCNMSIPPTVYHLLLQCPNPIKHTQRSFSGMI
jgi:hypothetical protein